MGEVERCVGCDSLPSRLPIVFWFMSATVNESVKIGKLISIANGIANAYALPLSIQSARERLRIKGIRYTLFLTFP